MNPVRNVPEASKAFYWYSETGLKAVGEMEPTGNVFGLLHVRSFDVLPSVREMNDGNDLTLTRGRPGKSNYRTAPCGQGSTSKRVIATV